MKLSFLIFSSVKQIIIEKLAFQNIRMFEKAILLFKKKKIKCWINCPRREQKIYKLIKKENKNNKKLSIEVVGKRWNLASNSIHFFDLFYFLNDALTFSDINKTIEAFRKVISSF